MDTQTEINALKIRLDQMEKSYDITIDTENALRERLGLNVSNQSFPVGSVYTSVVSTDPSILLGYGTWSAFATGQTLVGIDTNQTEFATIELTGGSKTHTLSIAELPAHTHDMRYANGAGSTTNSTTSGSTSTNTSRLTGSTGGGGAHNNLQPYITVYFWKRTA